MAVSRYTVWRYPDIQYGGVPIYSMAVSRYKVVSQYMAVFRYMAAKTSSDDLVRWHVLENSRKDRA